jgi:hypothetical protein
VTGAPPFGSRLPGLQNHLHQQQKTHQVQTWFSSRDCHLPKVQFQLSQVEPKKLLALKKYFKILDCFP